MSQPDLTPNIASSAQGPKRASADGVDVEQMPVPEQIQADRYVKAQQAATNPGFGLRIQKIIPPGGG